MLQEPCAKDNNSIEVHWEMEYNKRLNNPEHFNLHYCPVENCTKYISKNITASNRLAMISGLITYAKYEFKVRAVGITARDGTRVWFPEGHFSDPVFGRTKEGGKSRSVFLCRCHKVSLWPELLQVWLTLTRVNYHINL